MEIVCKILGVKPFQFPDKKDATKTVHLVELHIGEPINPKYGKGMLAEKKVCDPEPLVDAFGSVENAVDQNCYVYYNSNGKPSKFVPLKK